MSNVCCKEFQGWCKSFTKTEVLLCVLQAIFLVVFLAFITFLILHLVVCSKNKQINESVPLSQNESKAIINTNLTNKKIENSKAVPASDLNDAIALPAPSDHSHTEVNESLKVPTTLDRGVTCTWKPSQKTKALTHYYENYTTLSTAKTITENKDKQPSNRVKKNDENDMYLFEIDNNGETELENNKLQEHLLDGKEVYDPSKDFLLALVKIKPPQGITFGCTLTIVNEYWTLTAASCIEAIEEVDSLDSFVMMQGFKGQDQNIHPVADVMIHPQYEGVNVTFDLAALKSEGRLVNRGTMAAKLPILIDYFLISIGEALIILGYGRFRNIDKDPLTRTVREVDIHSMPLSQCPTGTGSWSTRHLTGGAPVEHGACGASPICAGVLRSRTSPCNYCSGTPLLRRGVLLGVMSDNQHCGLSCEPALFVNLAFVRGWLDSVLSN